MASLIVQENGAPRTKPAVNGEEITIQAPCDCSAVTGVMIAGVVFPFYDACGNNVSNIDGKFGSGSLIRVMIDTINTRSYILNQASPVEKFHAAHHAAGGDDPITPTAIGAQNRLAWVTETGIDAMFSGTYSGTEDESAEASSEVLAAIADLQEQVGELEDEIREVAENVTGESCDCSKYDVMASAEAARQSAEAASQSAENARQNAIAAGGLATQAVASANLADQRATEAERYAARAEQTIGKTSYIGDDGNWYEWDALQNDFTNTGVRAQGEKGDAGATGPQGPQGEPGAKGDTGAAGKDGADGAKGDKGDKGDTGAAGKDGADGATIFWCNKATTGTNVGATYIIEYDTLENYDKTPKVGDFIICSNGFLYKVVDVDSQLARVYAVCLQKLRGEKGEKGEKGETGAAGKDGADGAKGDKGDTGESGYSIFYAEDSFGRDIGTYYSMMYADIETNGRDIKIGDIIITTGGYICRVTNLLESMCAILCEASIKGAQGEKGKTGAAGADGADGISCTHSWNGTTLTVTSASGTSSADLKGEKGDKGETGAQGEKGETGAAGFSIFCGHNSHDRDIGDHFSIMYADIETNDRDVKEGDIIITTGGYVCRVVHLMDSMCALVCEASIKGAQGEKGQDYVLTEADKTEIAEQAAELVEVPESGAAQSDWNANEGEAGHVLNRTHWVKYAELLPPTVAIPSGSETGEVLIASVIEGVLVGDTYTVNYNGTNYECVGADLSDLMPGAVSLGDVGVFETGEPTGTHPFCMIVLPADVATEMGAGATIFPLDGASSVTVSISGEIIHKLDPKFINSEVFTVVAKATLYADKLNVFYRSASYQATLAKVLEPNTLVQAKVFVYVNADDAQPVMCQAFYYGSSGADSGESYLSFFSAHNSTNDKSFMLQGFRFYESGGVEFN
jgi:preprotein translocase subunit YajC